MSSESLERSNDKQLPTDILTTILSKQSVKSILRFKLVCKTWLKIIETPQFHQQHLLTSKNGNPSSSCFIFIEGMKNDLGFLIEDEKVPCGFTIKKISLQTKILSYKRLEPPVDGLVFYFSEKRHDQSDTSMYICNPVLQKHVKLPDFDFSRQQFHPNRGFGFDVTGNQYKVVLISRSFEVSVYILGTSSWRNVGEAPNVNLLTSSGACLHGYLYWLANKDGVDGVRDLSKQILSFDLSSEQFEIFQIGGNSLSSDGNCIFELGNDCFQILALAGCLVVVDFSFHDKVQISVSNNNNVKEGWNTYIVSKSCVGRMLFKRVTIISIRNHTEFILLCDSKYLILFDTVTQKAKKRVVLEGFDSTFDGPFSYVESLILPPPVEQRGNPGGMQERERKQKPRSF